MAAPTLFDRLFPFTRQPFIDPTTAVTLMSLNALVYLDLTPVIPQLLSILGAASIVQLPSPAQFVPATLFVRNGARVVVVYEGTRGIEQWFSYVTGAGVSAIGPSPGVVFAPFAASVRQVQPGTLANINPADAVLVTGHSLGAAVAGIQNSLLTQQGFATRLAWLFACPRYCDDAFKILASGQTVTVNLPNDPIPLLPPDLVSFVQRDPAAIRWSQVFSRLTGSSPLASWFIAGLAPGGLDPVAELAAANLFPRYSPHQTYQYIRSTFAGLNDQSDPGVVALKALLIQLGLFDPWPA